MIYGASIVGEVQVIACIELSRIAIAAVVQRRQDTYWYWKDYWLHQHHTLLQDAPAIQVSNSADYNR
jgi:hypothetical protein